MGVRMGELILLQWLNSFIFFNTMNGELDRLHQKWLGAPMAAAADAVTSFGSSRGPRARISYGTLADCFDV